MNLFDNKRAELATITLIILIIIFVLGWLINLGTKECRSNTQCGDGYYCGSDFSCHQIPTIEKTIVKNNLVVPSIIIGIAIIIAAIVLRSAKMPLGKNTQQETDQEKSYKNPLKMP